MLELQTRESELAAEMVVAEYDDRSDHFDGWGWLPLLSLVSAIGLLFIAFAFTTARTNGPDAYGLFWVGEVLVFAPIAARLISVAAARRERLGIVLVAGVLLYLVKVIHDPAYFTSFDERLHLRTAQDIVRFGHLFHQNPLFPISHLFPGLEIATSGLSNVSGVPLFLAGTLIIGTARIILLLSLFLLYEEASQSARVAGIATAFYMANPNFLFFDSIFAYESLAIGFAAFVLFCILRSSRTQGRDRLGLTVASLLGLGLISVTHHVTTYILLLLLTTWTIVRSVLMFRHPRASAQRPGGMALLSAVVGVSWMTFIATKVVHYLAVPLQVTFTQVVHVILREQQPRQLYHGYGAEVTPLFEQLVGLAAVGFVLVLLPLGFFQVWRRERTNPIVVVLALVGLLYPPSLAGRFTSGGAEVAARTSPYVFIGAAFVLGLGVAGIGPLCHHVVRAINAGMFACWVGVVFLGGLENGWGPVSRVLPGPYLVVADARSIEPEGITAARWAYTFLGPDNPVVTDRANRMLMLTEGEQDIVTAFRADIVNPSPIILSPSVDAAVLDALQRDHVRYVVMDRRLGDGLPLFGLYVEDGEKDGRQHSIPVAPEALAKFDNVPNAQRIFDSGHIIIYDVRALSNAP